MTSLFALGNGRTRGVPRRMHLAMWTHVLVYVFVAQHFHFPRIWKRLVSSHPSDTNTLLLPVRVVSSGKRKAVGEPRARGEALD